MKASAIWVAALLLTAALGSSGSCLAGESGAATKPGAVLSLLAGTAVPAAELGNVRARGITINTGSGAAAAAGTSANNAVILSPVTGLISNDHSIDNNAGITTVLQNFGNNSIMQTSTTINITVH